MMLAVSGPALAQSEEGVAGFEGTQEAADANAAFGLDIAEPAVAGEFENGAGFGLDIAQQVADENAAEGLDAAEDAVAGESGNDDDEANGASGLDIAPGSCR
jgi:hypothetical protein